MGNWQPIFVFNSTFNPPNEIKFTDAKLLAQDFAHEENQTFLASPAKFSFTEYIVNVKF